MDISEIIIVICLTVNAGLAVHSIYQKMFKMAVVHTLVMICCFIGVLVAIDRLHNQYDQCIESAKKASIQCIHLGNK